MSVERLPFPLGYTAEQQAAIEAAWAERYTDSGVEYHRDGVFFERTSHQLFAVFGSAAMELWCHRISEADGAVWEAIPAALDGHAVWECPDEGREGVLHLMRFVACPERPRLVARGWFGTFLARGWIRADELQASAAEILEHIAQEVDRGQTPLTGGVPGWA